MRRITLTDEAHDLLKYASIILIVWLAGMLPCLMLICNAPGLLAASPFFALVLTWSCVLPRIYPPD